MGEARALSDTAAAEPWPWLGTSGLRPLQIAVGLFVGVKLGLLVFAHPFMDEAYYFIWGQHPALSYYDHPGLVGWVQGLSATLLGWNLVALRLPVLLTELADVWLLYLFARRMGGASWPRWFWPALALFVSMPIFVVATMFGLPDHLLLLATLAAAYLLQGFFLSLDAGSPRWRLLYAGATAIGCAVLAKYYGGLVGVGLALTVLAMPRYRGLLRSPHLYLAAALALALQAPSLIWNIQNNYAGVGFVVGGHGHLEHPFELRGVLGYLLDMLLIVSPFLIVPMLRFGFARQPSLAVSRGIFWTSTLAFLVASVFVRTIIHWNLAAYAAVLPFLAGFIRSRLLALTHFTYAAVIVVLGTVNYAAVPLAAVFGFNDQASSWGYGWDGVAARVRQIEASQPIGFVAGTDYTLAAALGWALEDKDVTSLATRTDAYDFWFDADAMTGKTALIVADHWRPLSAEIRARFAEVTAVGGVEVSGYGRPIDTYELYVGTGYTPATRQP
ncbi:MAG: glycosyltransferase family 39 protein [Devosia sp.]